jgi:hypothetical protein
VEVLMRLANAPKFVAEAPRFVAHECRVIYEKVAHHKKTEEPPGAHLYDSGLSVVGDWILDLAVVALIAVVAGAVLKWAYVSMFHK